VTFTRSGLTVAWAPSYTSLLELAEACDVPVRFSCRTGVCHYCETGLLTGTLAYSPVTGATSRRPGPPLLLAAEYRGDTGALSSGQHSGRGNGA
jgi:ferredoxin